LSSGKPIIGIVGGIGSGKSFVAGLFGEFGCLVIHSDKLVDSAYNDPVVQRTLESWWGRLDREALADRVFVNAADRRRLEGLIFPIVARQRLKMMAEAESDPKISAFVWDSPLLLEAGLQKDCDAIVFVSAPRELRLARVAASRGWDEAELSRRENLQWPLDKKQKISEYRVDNTADADYARGQVKDVLFRIRGHFS
jgi:dephospho-CoA kinase